MNRVQTKPWILRRLLLGTFNQLTAELNKEDMKSYSNFMDTDADIFQELIGKKKWKTRYKERNASTQRTTGRPEACCHTSVPLHNQLRNH